MSVIATNRAIAEADQLPTLHYSNFQTTGQFYEDFQARLPVGVTVKDALRPEFWVHVVHLFKPNPTTGTGDATGSVIELRTEDHAFYARLYVRAVQERGLVVELMSPDKAGVCYFGPKKIAYGEGFKTRWNVGKKGFDIIRKSDKEIVGDGAKFPTKEMANDWILETSRV